MLKIFKGEVCHFYAFFYNITDPMCLQKRLRFFKQINLQIVYSKIHTSPLMLDNVPSALP